MASTKSLIAIQLCYAFFCWLCITCTWASIACKDKEGNDVDWFYAYKLPKGAKFVYITSNTHPVGWTWSNASVDDEKSLIGLTVAQGFGDNNEKLVIAYNDEPPVGKTDSIRGHTKGLVVADARSGFWLIHSVPKFPEISNNSKQYSYPPTGHMYGQSFLCISVKSTQVNNIGTQLMYNEPHIYTSEISEALSKKYPNVVQAVDRVTIKNAPFWHEADIVSTDGTKFRSFAKSRRFGQDLYVDLIAPELKTDLYVEGWIHGTGVRQTNCSEQYKVYNVEKMLIGKFDYTFASSDDHSKWTVGTGESGWICVGDVNRALGQEKRGGGTVCQDSTLIARAFRSSVKAIEPCPKAFSFFSSLL